MKNRGKILDEDEEDTLKEEPANKGKRLLLLLIPLVIAIIAAIFYAVVHFFNAPDTTSTKEKGKETQASTVKPEYAFIAMDDIIVNLASTGSKKSFLKIVLILQISDKETSDIISTKIPMINDSFQVFLRELRPSDFSGSAGVIMLKAELLKRVNKIVAPNEVMDILFKEILLS